MEKSLWMDMFPWEMWSEVISLYCIVKSSDLHGLLKYLIYDVCYEKRRPEIRFDVLEW